MASGRRDWKFIKAVSILQLRQGAAWSKTHPLVGWLLVGVVLLMATYLFLWGMFVYPQQHISLAKCSALPVVVSLHYPDYVSLGDEGFVEVGLRNTGTRPISGTAVIAFGGDLTVHPVASKTNVLTFSALPPNGIMAGRVYFTLNEPLNRQRSVLPVAIQIAAGRPCNLAFPSPLRLTPIPGLKTLLRSILSFLSVVIGLPLVGLLWEQIKKQLFPEEKSKS